MESWLFLALVLVVALLGKNMSLIIATGVVMVFKLLPFTSKWLPTIQAKGINWGRNYYFGCNSSSYCDRTDWL